MLPVIYQHPQMEFEGVLTSINYQNLNKKEILSRIPYLQKSFRKTAMKDTPENEAHWITGQLRKAATGNVDLRELHQEVKSIIQNKKQENHE